MSDYSVRAVLSAVDNGFKSTLDSAADSVSKLDNTAQKVGGKLTSAGDAMTKGITVPVMAIGTAATAAASSFETSMAKLSTIADTSGAEGSASMEELESSIKKLSNQYGVSASEIAESTYQAISAGRSTAEAVSFVETATRLAKSGFTDAATATDTLTTIMNAYGDSAGSATSISDKLIMAQNLGKTSVAELGSSMGKVIPTASMFGVSLDQLASAYVTTTKNGIATAESTTYINGMLNELGKSGSTASAVLKDKTGKSFAELMADGNSLTDVLGILQESADETGKSMSDMFGSQEAGKAAATLVQHAEDFNDAMTQMGASAGTTETAFAKMENTTSTAMEKMKTSAVNALIGLGNAILPVLVPAVETLTDKIGKLSEWFTGLDDGTKKTIITVAGMAAAAGPLLSILGKGTTIVGGLVGKFTAFSSVSKTATETATSAAGGMGKLSSNASGIAALGVAIFLTAAGFALLAQSSIALANAGGPAIAVMAGMVVAVGGLIAVVALVGSHMTIAAAGLLAVGAAVLLCAAGFYVMAAAATMLADSGGAAIAVFAGMVVGIAGLMAVAAALGPALIAGGAGALLLGAGLLLCGTGALLAAASLAIITGLLPQLTTYGSSGAAAITKLGASLIVFGAGAITAGAGATVLGAGLIVAGGGALIAVAGMAALAVALAAVTVEMATISASASSAASDISSMSSGVSVVESGLKAISSIASSAGKALVSMFTSSEQSASSAGKAIGTQLNQNIAKGMTQMVTTGTKMMTAFNLTLTSGGLKATATARAISSTVPAALQSGVSGATQSGQMMGQGFANGILNMRGAVASAAAQLVGAANRSITVTAQIHSPSRITTWMGEMEGQGWVNGILNKVRDAVAAGRALANAPNVALGNMATTEGYSYGSSGAFTVMVPLSIDGREFARATATYNNEELTSLQTRNLRAQGIR